MYNRSEFLDKSAEGALANNKRQQEERRMAMLREQKARDLKQFETQLFYRKQEVNRLQTLLNRMKREAVVKQSTLRKNQQEVQMIDRQSKETQERLQKLEQQVAQLLVDIGTKIARETKLIEEHQRNLELLETEKEERSERNTEQQKKTISQTISGLLFSKKRGSQELEKADRLFQSNQVQIQGFEKSLQTFTQEAKVLENKIRALRSKPL